MQVRILHPRDVEVTPPRCARLGRPLALLALAVYILRLKLRFRFGLSRPDIWPVLDFGVRKGLGLTFGKRAVPTPKQAQLFARRFSPYGSVAAWYFWRACES